MCKQKDSEGRDNGNRCLPGYIKVTVRLRETLATDPGGRSGTFLGRTRARHTHYTSHGPITRFS